MEPLINNNQLCKSHSHLAGNAENHTHHRLFDKSVAEPLSSSYSPSNFSLRPPFPPPAFSVQLPNLPGVPHGPPYHMDVFCLLSCFHRQWLERPQWRSVPRRSPYAVTINQKTDKHLRLLKVKLRVLRSISCQYSVFFVLVCLMGFVSDKQHVLLGISTWLQWGSVLLLHSFLRVVFITRRRTEANKLKKTGRYYLANKKCCFFFVVANGFTMLCKDKNKQKKLHVMSTSDYCMTGSHHDNPCLLSVRGYLSVYKGKRHDPVA